MPRCLMASSHDTQKSLFRLLYIGYKDLWSLQVVGKKNLNIHLDSIWSNSEDAFWDPWTSRITWGLTTQVFYLVPVFSIPNNRWKPWPKPQKPKSENGGMARLSWAGPSCEKSRHGETDVLLLATHFHSKLGIVTLCDFHDSHIFHPEDLFYSKVVSTHL